jgi:hypothetical protein
MAAGDVAGREEATPSIVGISGHRQQLGLREAMRRHGRSNGDDPRRHRVSWMVSIA